MKNEDINRIAWKLGIKPSEVKIIYKLYWKYIYEFMINLDTDNPKSYRRASFNIPKLGKFIFSEQKLKCLKSKLNGKKDKKC